MLHSWTTVNLFALLLMWALSVCRIKPFFRTIPKIAAAGRWQNIFTRSTRDVVISFLYNQNVYRTENKSIANYINLITDGDDTSETMLGQGHDFHFFHNIAIKLKQRRFFLYVWINQKMFILCVVLEKKCNGIIICFDLQISVWVLLCFNDDFVPEFLVHNKQSAFILILP